MAMPNQKKYYKIYARQNKQYRILCTSKNKYYEVVYGKLSKGTNIRQNKYSHTILKGTPI